MGIFRSITKLTHLSKSHKPIFNLSSILNPTSLYLSNPLSPSLSPLFPSSHPSTPSQYATPFCLQSDVVLTPSFQVLVSPNFSRVNFGVKQVGSGEENVGGGDPVKKGGGGGGGGVDGFVNLPNLISMSRLISGPVIGWMILQEMYLPAFVGLAVSGATDWLEGYVARKMGINSVVGSYLDPLADKVLIGSVALAMVDKGLLNSIDVQGGSGVLGGFVRLPT